MKNNLLYSASLAHFEAKRIEALATLQIYFTTPVGISEHSSHVEEVIAWTKRLAEAEESIATLNKIVQQQVPDEQE